MAGARAEDRDSVIAEIRRQIEALRVEQAERIKAIEAETDVRIRSLVQALDQIDGGAISSASTPSVPAGDSRGAAPPPEATRLSGDVRLRFEGNYADQDAPDRERGVLRARLDVRHSLSPSLAVGARLATGDPDDPNSTDVTLSSFDDDLDVSLDQVYARFDSTQWTLIGGKFAPPMARTEMVWDSDVNPEGVAATFRSPWGRDRADLDAHFLYFVIDEQAAGKDSGMAGAQLAARADLSPDWGVEFSAAYYDYDVHALTNADAGDIRDNRLKVDQTRYLSDFDLLDVIGAVQFRGLGPKWPVRLLGDVVRNLDAEDAQRHGYDVELSVGQVKDPNHWRFAYAFAAVEADAVFAAFSHDNTQISTNYRQHSLAVDYVPAAHTLVNATWYVYRPYRALEAGDVASLHDWLNRVRLNFAVSF